MFRFRNRRGGDIPISNDGFLPLTKMQDGQRGKIMRILGGRGIIERLNALGIRQGQIITRIGGMYLRGPVTIKIEKSQVAIGFGVATRILVELEK